VVDLLAKHRVSRCCSGCGRRTRSIHDAQERRVRDLPIFEVPVELMLPRLRVRCPSCGPKLESLDWLDPYARVTKRLAVSVARMCKVMSIRHVASFYGLAWDTVKDIDYRYLERELGPVDFEGDDAHARRLVKGSRWLLLRNRENVTHPQDQVRLDELLAANKALMTVYVLKDDLKALWRYRHAGYARAFWDGWHRRAMQSGIEPLKTFTRRLTPYLDGILAHCRWPLGTNIIEGINNKIKVIKRMAYGFRNDAYFFLKIRAAFPGNP